MPSQRTHWRIPLSLLVCPTTTPLLPPSYQQIEIMKRIRHRHVVSMYELYETPKCLWIILELVNNGGLHHYMAQVEVTITHFLLSPFCTHCFSLSNDDNIIYCCCCCCYCCCLLLLLLLQLSDTLYFCNNDDNNDSLSSSLTLSTSVTMTTTMTHSLLL